MPLVSIPDLKDKVCLVTGASRGIGAAVARGFGAAGARVAVHYNSARQEAEAVASDIKTSGGRAHILQGDISQDGTIERLLNETVSTFGRLDILINNAGDLIRRYPIAETPDSFFDTQIATNVKPVFVACRGAIGQFRKQGGGGVIINLSSVAARTGGGGGSALYAASKAFVATLTRAYAKEVAGEGIRINAVSPGVIDTPMQHRTTPPEQIAAALGAIPMKRMAAANECVGTFLYLASNELSGYVTGQVVEVNGGLLMP
jgi:3-oxoacyl-[acyl-carrier protein] reductase